MSHTYEHYIITETASICPPIQYYFSNGYRDVQ
jgi:hypothetical protein